MPKLIKEFKSFPTEAAAVSYLNRCGYVTVHEGRNMFYHRGKQKVAFVMPTTTAYIAAITYYVDDRKD